MDSGLDLPAGGVRRGHRDPRSAPRPSIPVGGRIPLLPQGQGGVLRLRQDAGAAPAPWAGHRGDTLPELVGYPPQAQDKPKGKRRHALERICGYLHNNARRMACDACLEHGFPIASSVIEGACRCVVKNRMERSGMRWVFPGAHAMLEMRCIHLSDLWEAFTSFRIQHEPSACIQDAPPTRQSSARYSPRSGRGRRVAPKMDTESTT